MRLLSLLLLAGCLKPSALQAPPGTSVALGSVVQDATDRAASPDSVAAEAVADALARRGIAVTPVTLDVPHRDRLQTLAGAGSGLVVLVESTPRFSSQMNGRYRWTVAVNLRIARADALDQAETVGFTVPVHLLFAHEGAEQALAEASPSIARRVGRLVDDWTASP